jgi:hypothetical protein
LLTEGEVKRKSRETFPQKNPSTIYGLQGLLESTAAVEKIYKAVENWIPGGPDPG